MKKAIVTAVFGVILSTSAVAEAQKFRFEFLNEQGTEALGVGHGHFDPDEQDTLTIEPDHVFLTHRRLTQIGITVNGTTDTGANDSVGYVHKDANQNINDLHYNTWLNTDDQKGAGYSEGTEKVDGTEQIKGTERVNGKWRFGMGDRNLTLNFENRTWTQNTMKPQAEGEVPVQIKSNGIFRLRMVESEEELGGLLDKVINEDTTSIPTTIDSPPLSSPGSPASSESTTNIFDNTMVNETVENAKAAEAAKSSKSGSGALGFGFLAFLALPMVIRRRRSHA
jgi:hypothetical protein